jgi:hypothetical protein
MYKCVTTQVDSSVTDLYTGSWSPSHVDFCRFKVSVLVPCSGDIKRFLSCFGFATYSYISRMCSPLVKGSKSNHIAVFALDLKSAYEGEHMIFGLLRAMPVNSFTWEILWLIGKSFNIIVVNICSFFSPRIYSCSPISSIPSFSWGNLCFLNYQYLLQDTRWSWLCRSLTKPASYFPRPWRLVLRLAHEPNQAS